MSQYLSLIFFYKTASLLARSRAGSVTRMFCEKSIFRENLITNL
nr:MAG TPA: hypothetical protein [Caudoviricetes sp.]